jgi:hypothetical protein
VTTLSKLHVAQFILSTDSLFLYLDPRGDDVTVPPWFKHQPELCLQFGLNMPVPIPDLHLDETGIYGTLSFSQTPFTCAVPWKAVWMLRPERAGVPFLWESDRPTLPETVTVLRGNNKKLPKGWAVVDGGRK